MARELGMVLKISGVACTAEIPTTYNELREFADKYGNELDAALALLSKAQREKRDIKYRYMEVE